MKKVVLFFLQILNNVQLVHWNTHSFAAHKATDHLYKALHPLVDSFVEILLQTRLAPFEASIPVAHFTQAKFKTYLKNVIKILIAMKLEADLANIRDEMVGHIHQFLYLYTLHG
jgi:DNA-binding ferritin-like protein